MSKNIADMIFAVTFVQEAKARMTCPLGTEVENSKRCADMASQMRDFYLAGLSLEGQEGNDVAFLDPEFSEEMFDIWNDDLIRTKAEATAEIERMAKEYYPQWTMVKESVNQWEIEHKAYFPIEDNKDRYAEQLINAKIGIHKDYELGYCVVIGCESLSWKRFVNAEFWSASNA